MPQEPGDLIVLGSFTANMSTLVSQSEEQSGHILRFTCLGNPRDLNLLQQEARRSPVKLWQALAQ